MGYEVCGNCIPFGNFANNQEAYSISTPSKEFKMSTI